MARVLVVDDDPALLRALRLALRARGYDVVAATKGEEGISQAALVTPDVIVLDLGLADMDGLTVCRRLRQWSDVPIIVLSANHAEDRKVAALDQGADDYVTKPFGMAELEARIRTAIRHRRAEPEAMPATVTVGALSLEPEHHRAYAGGAAIKLTAKEFDVLSFLMRHAENVCTHEMILAAVWGAGYAKESQYLHVHISRLRQKISDVPGVALETVPGVGYVLTAKGDWSLTPPDHDP